MIDQVKDTLEECREYFDARADADQPVGTSYPIGNEEMRLLTAVDLALASYERKMKALTDYVAVAPLDLKKLSEIQGDLRAILDGKAWP